MRPTALLLSSLLATLAVAVGCGSSEEIAASVPPGDPPPPPPPPPRPPIAFTPCSLQTGGSDGRAECAEIEVPLDWAQPEGRPEGRNATFFVKRLRGSAAGTHKQLWLLAGGPGGAGDGLETLVNELSKDPLHDSFDIYIPDHRGTGRSAFLDCPEALKFPPFDYAACAAEAEKAWGKEGLGTFTTTTAARDVGDTIERLRTAGQDVHVYGVSYGTYWAQRYMQLYPTQPTAVTLDSMCGPGLCNYLTIGYWFDRVGRKLMADCAADATCGAKLGPDPAAKVAEAISIADKKTCAGLKGVNGDTLQRIFTWFVASVEFRALIPAVTYRAVRCSAEDVTALTRFVSNVRVMTGGGFAPSGEDLSSTVLGFHIAFSEMMPNPMNTRAELAKLYEGAIFAKNDPSLYDAYEAWPKYARDQNVGKYPTAASAMLMLNGTHDPQTPQEFAQEVATHYTGANQSFVLLPRAAHGTLRQSPVSPNRTDDACGMIVWKQFLASPSGPLDVSCKDRILPHDFSDSQPLAQSFFGVSSFWGLSDRGPARRDALVAPAHLRRELDRAMRATRPWVPVATQRAELASAFERELAQ